MTRKESREEAFKLIFSLDVQMDEFNDRIEEWKCALNEQQLVQSKYTLELVNVVYGHIDTIDEIIVSCLAKGWKKSRISRVSMASLRLACGEILYTDTPEGVAANENVEIAKNYEDSKAAKFVNGILSTVIARKDELTCI